MNDAARDDVLMDLVCRGSSEAFRELVERWQAPLHQFFRLMGIDRSAAEDCLQETFLRLFAYRGRYRPRHGGFRAFIFRLGRNVSVDLFRRAGRSVAGASLESEPAVAAGAVGIDDRLDCEWALAHLPERLRAVVVLSIYEGLSYREIADVLDLPVGTIKSRMHYALIRLRSAFEDEERDLAIPFGASVRETP